MRVEVLLFASLREQAGVDRVVLDLAGPVPAAELRRAVAEQHPALAGSLAGVRVAVDRRFVDDAAQVSDPRAEVALIPPVSGG